MGDQKNEIPILISEQSTSTQIAAMAPPVITEPTSNLDVQATIADRIQAAANAYTNKIFRYMLFVVGGALIASVWNLNGQINQAIGSSGVAAKSLEIEVSRLNEEIKKLEQQIKQRDCLDNKRVIDKAGCYRGN